MISVLQSNFEGSKMAIHLLSFLSNFFTEKTLQRQRPASLFAWRNRAMLVECLFLVMVKVTFRSGRRIRVHFILLLLDTEPVHLSNDITHGIIVAGNFNAGTVSHINSVSMTQLTTGNILMVIHTPTNDVQYFRWPNSTLTHSRTLYSVGWIHGTRWYVSPTLFWWRKKVN